MERVLWSSGMADTAWQKMPWSKPMCKEKDNINQFATPENNFPIVISGGCTWKPKDWKSAFLILLFQSLFSEFKNTSPSFLILCWKPFPWPAEAPGPCRAWPAWSGNFCARPWCPSVDRWRDAHRVEQPLVIWSTSRSTVRSSKAEKIQTEPKPKANLKDSDCRHEDDDSANNFLGMVE